MSFEIEQCPVLRPTMKEFQNFYEYVEAAEQKYCKQFGMVKIIPPPQWKARKDDYEAVFQEKMVQGPIEQNPQGKGGIYESLHIVKKSIPLREYMRKKSQFDNTTDGKSEDEVEQIFWRNIAFSPPLYGIDIKNSLFDDGVQWNLRSLSSLLTKGLAQNLSGVTEPYLYIGSWKTYFAWHKEDLDLESINYLHYGKPKAWYAIVEQDSHKLEEFAKAHFADNFAKCPEYLRHKTTLINPTLLMKKFNGQIKICKTVQHQNEFMLLFSGAYHQGFNWGFNIAEAVNYACLPWLTSQNNRNYCKCQVNQVRIDLSDFADQLNKKLTPSEKNQQIIKKFFEKFLKAKLEKSKIEKNNVEKEEIVKTRVGVNKKIKKIANKH